MLKWIGDFRCNWVFFSSSDFNLATPIGIQGGGYTYDYTSSNRYEGADRCSMDDLESLIFTMWHVAGFDFSETYGELLVEQKKKEKAISWVTVSETISIHPFFEENNWHFSLVFL